MGMDGYAVLGNVVDPFNEEESQEDVNERSIHMYHQRRLLDMISERISRYELKYLYEELSRTTPEFWHLVLRQIIKVYTLNSLKPYQSDGYSTIDIIRETRKLLVFIKIVLVQKELDKINNRQDIEELFKKIDAPILIKIAIKYIDNESLGYFLETIKEESKKDYLED